jgi:hypothetical protein
VPVRVVLNYQPGAGAAQGRWRVVVAVLTMDSVPDLRERIGAIYTLRLSDGHESRVFLHDANPANPRYPSLKATGERPLFVRDP